MKIDLSHVILTALIPTASSIYLMVPTTGFKCAGDVTISNQQLADYVQSSCEHRFHAKQSRFTRYLPIQGPLSPRPYRGTKFAAMSPLFEVGVRENWRQAVFAKQPLRAVFEWNDKNDICIPYGIVYKGKSGKEERCREIRIKFQNSFNSHPDASEVPNLSRENAASPPESPRGAKKPIPDPRDAASSSRKTSYDRFAESEPFRKLRGFFRQDTNDASSEDRSSGHRRAQSMEEKTGSFHDPGSPDSSNDDILLSPGLLRHQRSKSFTEGSNKNHDTNE